MGGLSPSPATIARQEARLTNHEISSHATSDDRRTVTSAFCSTPRRAGQRTTNTTNPSGTNVYFAQPDAAVAKLRSLAAHST